MSRPVPTEAETKAFFSQEFFDQHSNWGRWGKEDEAGTLNYITPAKRTQAAALVKDGTTVSCSRPLTFDRAPDVLQQPLHFITGSGERWVNAPKVGGPQAAADWVGLPIHGLTITHLDALGHHFHNGQMYNGVPSDRVSSYEGSTSSAIETAKEVGVTRGILLDFPRLRKVKWLERGEPIYREDLEEAEKAAGVRVESGDLLLIRTGSYRRRLDEGPVEELTAGRPGLYGNCIPFVHEREVAILGGDSANDVSLPGPFGWLPFHHVGLVSMGLWLLDNANLEELGAACAERNRWEFMVFVGPLRLHNATGSPVNPIAVF